MKIKSVLICTIMTILFFAGCTQNVKNKEITIIYDGKTLTGYYTGTLNNGVPDGEGTFVSKSEERNFDYNGQWEKGNIVGNGKLTDTKYVVYFTDVERIGEFSGDVKDGKAHGNGTFKATNEENEKYIYTGEWKNGLWDGQGVQKFENTDYYVRTGTFTDGEFTPNKLEFIKSVGDCDTMRFTPTEKAEEFIKMHSNFFPTEVSADITEYIDNTITYKNLIKSPSKYGDKLIKLSNYQILQIWEEQEAWGYTCTTFLACSSTFDDYVFGYYLGELPSVYEGSWVTIEGLPISNSKFENIGGGTTLCYVIYGCKIK